MTNEQRPDETAPEEPQPEPEEPQPEPEEPQPEPEAEEAQPEAAAEEAQPEPEPVPARPAGTDAARPARPATAGGYRGALPPREDRLAAPWLALVVVIFVMLFVLAFLDVPNRFFAEDPPPEVPLPTIDVSPEPTPEAS